MTDTEEGKIIGTCGHEINWDWFDGGKGNITVKDFDKEGQKCASCIVVCQECLKWYRKEKLIIKEGG